MHVANNNQSKTHKKLKKKKTATARIHRGREQKLLLGPGEEPGASKQTATLLAC